MIILSNLWRCLVCLQSAQSDIGNESFLAAVLGELEYCRAGSNC
jgi:hypothetical protein